MTFRAEQVKVGRAREMTASGYVFGNTPVAGAQTQFPNEVISGFDSLEQLDVKSLKVRGQNASAAQREVFQLVELKHNVEDSFQFSVQDGLWFANALGLDAQTGTPSGSSTTLSGAETPGQTSIGVVSGTGIANGDFIQILSGSGALLPTASEIRKVSSGGGTTTLVVDQGLSYNHASGATVQRLDPTQPIIHTITPLDTMPMPSSTLEVNFLDATSLSVYLQGVTVDSLSVAGGEADILMGTCNFKAQKAVKNTGALSTVTAITTKPYNFAQGTFSYFGTAIARIQQWNSTINNGGKLMWYHNSTTGQFPFEFIPGAATYTLDSTVMTQDTTFFDALKNAGAQAQGAMTCSITYTRGTNDTLVLSYTNCELKSAPHSVPEEAEVPIKLEFVPRNLTVTVTQTPLSTAYAVWV